MNRRALRNVWLVLKREYLIHVRTKSFILTTLLLPVFLIVIVAVPAMMAGGSPSRGQRLVIVCSDARLAGFVQEQLERSIGTSSQVEVEPETSEAARMRLARDLSRQRIDGYIWI